MSLKMMNKTIIYYRKSTDRDDKQANSLEHQLENCRKIAISNNFEVLKEIGESRSAKTEYKRPWFNELITLSKSKKIDYIIIDEPKRLSRNNIDTSRIIDLLDKNIIKWIIWTSREYKADNSRDKFLLQLDLSLSKMDNEDRAKDIKEKMLTCMKNTKRFLGKAPFWYKNITIKKWHKEIIIDKKEAKIVKDIFKFRAENKAFNTIVLLIKEKYWENINISLRANRMNWLIKMKFYYWMFIWGGKEYIWNHTPIITKELYDKVNKVEKWVYEEAKSIEKKPRKRWIYHLKWFIKDTSWIMMCSYTKKGHTYYLTQPRSDEKINISENIIFEKFWEILKSFDVSNDILRSIDKDIILDLLYKQESEVGNNIIDIEKEIKIIKKKQENLLDMRLNQKVSEELYLLKTNKFENDIKLLKEQKLITKNENFEEKTQILFELAGSYCQSYFNGSKVLKSEIIKKLLFELFITTKKELQIEDSPIFKSSKMLKNLIGTPGRIRTHG